MSTQWYYASGGQPLGPFSVEQLRRLSGAGTLHEGDLVWRPGMADWDRAGRIDGLLNIPQRETYSPYSDNGSEVAGQRENETGDPYNTPPRRRKSSMLFGVAIVAVFGLFFIVGGAVFAWMIISRAERDPSLWDETVNWKIREREQRFFHFHLHQGERAEFKVEHNGAANMELAVYDDSGLRMARDSSPDKNCWVAFRVNRTGKYRVELRNRGAPRFIHPPGNNRREVGAVGKLLMRQTPLVPPEDQRPPSKLDEKAVVERGYGTSHLVWLNGNDRYVVSVTPQNLEMTVIVYNRRGDRIASARTFNRRPVSLQYAPFEPGVHRISIVPRIQGIGGNYQIRVNRMVGR